MHSISMHCIPTNSKGVSIEDSGHWLFDLKHSKYYMQHAKFVFSSINQPTLIQKILQPKHSTKDRSFPAIKLFNLFQSNLIFKYESYK